MSVSAQVFLPHCSIYHPPWSLYPALYSYELPVEVEVKFPGVLSRTIGG